MLNGYGKPWRGEYTAMTAVGPGGASLPNARDHSSPVAAPTVRAKLSDVSTRYDDPVLNTREITHGDYAVTAGLSQEIKNLLRRQIKWHSLSYMQKESLDLIAVKIARILSGDQKEPDHWVDIAGYANLVVARLPER